MKYEIEDDVLFIKEELLDEIEFDRIENKLYINNSINYINIHYDAEMEDYLIDENIPYSSEDVEYIYLNNEVYYLINLKL